MDNKGLALSDLNKNDEAIKAYDKAIEINPQDSNAWDNKGNALYDLNKTDEAIKAYNKAIEINPQNSIAWYNRASTYSFINNKDQVIFNLKKAVELDGSLKDVAKKDDAFKGLWKDEQFKEIVK